jgi:HAD superfamily hydrolase (TIGR01509 family)
MINAVVFDMDGLLLDSEPLWQEAEIDAFGSVGLTLTREQCMEYMGVPINEVVAERFRQKPWSGKSQDQLREEIIAKVEAFVEQRGTLLPGVREALAFTRSKGATCALASSSSVRLINAVLKKFDMLTSFDVVHSAEFEEYGKPHPGVFLTTAKKLGVEPTTCLVIEDSFNGILAAKAARMKVLAVPPKEYANDPRFVIADAVVESLLGFGEGKWHILSK